MGNSVSRRKAASQRQQQIQAKSRRLKVGGATPRFVADVMLGRLAKWLRIAGFDVLYSNAFTDDELVTLSRTEERILLSKDTRLLVRRVVRDFIFLQSDDIREQMRQVLRATGIRRLPDLLSRCLDCNEVLEQAEREQVQDLVPPFVFATQSSFKRCPVCRKLYWAGTHREDVIRTIESLL